MAFFGVVGPIILGSIIGLIGGYFGGRIDSWLMRLLEVTISFPYFVLVIAIVADLGPGLRSYFISLTLVNWVSYTRLLRSQALVLRNVDFVLAARGMGFSHRRIMLFHVLPNAVIPSVVFVMTDAVLTIVLGSSLGFLGLGVQPPTPEWGAMIAEGQTYLTSAWWISVFPGIAVCSLALGLSLAADGLARLLNTGP
jgi:peptide/nickel transport system permease protein